MELQDQIYHVFVCACKLTETHRNELKNRRALQDATIDIYFRSGVPDAVIPAIQRVRKKYSDQDIHSQTVLLEQDESGNFCPSKEILDGKILIIYYRQDGQPYFVRPHKGFRDGEEPKVFGQHSVVNVDTPVYIVEGEFKAAALHQMGLQALSLPGVSSFAGKFYDDFSDKLRSLGVKVPVFCFDNADFNSKMLPDGKNNPKYKDDLAKRYHPEYWEVHLGRRLRFDGFEVSHVRLPDAWRVNGEADIDGALASGLATEADLLLLLSNPHWSEDAFIEALPEDGRAAVRGQLDDGGFAKRSDGVFIQKGFPISAHANNIEKKTQGLKASSLEIFVNHRRVYGDQVWLDRDSDKEKFARKVSKKLDGQYKVDDAENVILQVLDDLYRNYIAWEKNQIQARQAKASANSERLVEIGGRSYTSGAGYVSEIRKDLDGCEIEKPISNFMLEVIQEIEINDGVKRELAFQLKVLKARESFVIEVPGGSFYQNLSAHLDKASTSLWYDDLSAVRNVCAAKSKATRIKITQKFGYQTDGAYVSASIVITPDGVIQKNVDRPLGLDDEEHACHLDLLHIDDDEEFTRLGRHVVEDFLGLFDDPVVSGTLLGRVGIAPLRVKLRLHGPCVLFLYGTTGVTKTHAARAAQCFYGTFGGRNQGKIQSWRSTANQIERVGHLFADAVYLVDDFKRANFAYDAAYRSALGVLQNYSDGTGRGRLNRDARVKPTYTIRGELVCTGEDMPSGQASNTARSLPIHVQNHGCFKKGKRVAEEQHKYSAITTRYIAWLMKQDMATIQSLYDDTFEFFLNGINEAPNSERVAANLAQSMLGFECMIRLFNESGIVTAEERDALLAEQKAGLMRLRKQLVRAIGEQKASTIFLRILGQLIVSCRVIVKNAGQVFDAPSNAPVVGFVKEDLQEYVCVFPEAAVKAVQDNLPAGEKLTASIDDIGRQLKSNGLSKTTEPGRAKVRLRWEGTRVFVWMIPREVLGVRESAQTRMGIPAPASESVVQPNFEEDDSDDNPHYH